METSAFIKQEDGAESAKVCRWCHSVDDALKPVSNDKSGQYKLQKLSECTGVQVKLLPGVPLYLCTMCNSRLEKQNTAKNESEITQEHLDHFDEQTVGTELLIKTEVTTPDAATDLHLLQGSCTAPQVNGTPEYCGNQPFEAEENPITIKLEYVDIDELYRLQTNAILDHEQDDLQTNPLALACQDREDQSISNNMCADGTEVSIKTEVTSPDTSKEVFEMRHQKCLSVHQANRTYECCGNIPDDLFEAEENPIAIKSEDEEDDEQHQLQTTNDGLNHEQDNLTSQSRKRKYHCSHCSSSFANLSSLKVHIRTHTGAFAPYVCKVCDNTFLSRQALTEHSSIHLKQEYHHCPHCPAKFALSTSLKNHIRTHTGERPYVCKVCGKAFHVPTLLAQHSKIHNKDQQHQCPHCSLRFAQLYKLKIHIRTHTAEKPYKCKFCDKAFYSKTNLAQHSKIHNKDQQHQCPHCSAMFANLSRLKIHIRTHTGERPYVCKICDKAFHSSSTLAKHSKIHNKDHQCPHCSLRFAQLYKLKRHIRIHTGERPYQCEVCDKAFYSANYLAKHSKIHNKDHQCPHCSSKFVQFYHLKIHIRTHTGEKPFVCKICSKAFRSQSLLGDHSKSHNKDKYQKCPHCPAKLALSSALKDHIRIHTGEKPFVCKTCKKAFHSSSALSHHSKIHNKDEYKQCPHCSSKFALSSGLKNHIRTHTGEKPYVCKVCDKAYGSSSTLSNHSKTHNKS